MKERVIFIVLLFTLISLSFGETGDVLKRLSAPYDCATGLAYDGKNIWIVDRKSDKIYKIDPDDGKVIKSFPSPGYFSTGLAWDGKHLWVSDMDFTNSATESYSGKIYEVCPESGRTLNVIMAPTSDPQGLAWDGKYLWVSDNIGDRIYKISPEDGTTIVSFCSPSSDPRGLAWDGEYLWIADRSKDEIYRMHPEKGVVVMIVPSPGPYPWGLAWKDGKLLSVDYQTDKIAELKIFDDVLFTRSRMRSAVIDFTNDIINFGPGTLKNLNIYIAEPEDRSTQDILSISYPTKPTKFLTDKWGQRVALFKFKDLSPSDRCTPVMSVRANIYDVMYHIFPERVGSLEDIPEEIKERYLQDGMKYLIHHPTIVNAVKEAVGNEKNPYWIARDIFDYLRNHMYYERSGGWNIAPTVLERGSGSCSEYTFVYIAMCRAAGLPARYVGSVVVRGEDASFDFVYHRWVEVYLPGYEWIPVDPSGGDKQWPRDQAMFFGHLSNRFLITTQGGGGSEYLSWDYNSYERWQADGPVQLRIEKIAEWNPLIKN